MNNYTTTGKVYEKGPITEGQSKNGNLWQRMTLVIDVSVGQYSKKMAFQVSTNNIKEVMDLNIGDAVEVTFDVSSREWTNAQGVRSWFGSVDLRSIKAVGSGANVPPAPAPDTIPEPTEDDLPFGNE